MARLKRMSSTGRGLPAGFGVGGPVGVGAIGGVGHDRQVRVLVAGTGDLVGPAHQVQRSGVVTRGPGTGEETSAKVPSGDAATCTLSACLRCLPSKFSFPVAVRLPVGIGGACSNGIHAADQGVGEVGAVHHRDQAQDRQQVTVDPRDRGLGDTVQVTGDLLGEVVPHQDQDHHDRTPERQLEVVPLTAPAALMDLPRAGDQLGRLGRRLAGTAVRQRLSPLARYLA